MISIDLAEEMSANQEHQGVVEAAEAVRNH